MVHGDNRGLKLPPRIAPTQVIVVPIAMHKEGVLDKAYEIKKSLEEKFRVDIDAREQYSPGYKFNEWELKGVPLRLEIGPKDIENEQVVLVRRDTNEKIIVKNINNIANYKQLVSSINTMEATTSKVANSVSIAITSQINKKIESQITELLSDEMIKQITTDIVNKTTNEINQVLKNYVTNENIDKVIDAINEKLESSIGDKISGEILNQLMPVVSKKVSELVAPKLTPVVNKITNEVASKVSVSVASTVADQVKDSTLSKVNSELITLVEGLEKFNNEGIQKLAETINEDVKNIEARMEALINLSNDYKTMDDINTEAEGSSKIIMIIDEVKKEKENKVNNEKIVEEKKSFGEKIKGLFTK